MRNKNCQQLWSEQVQFIWHFQLHFTQEKCTGFRNSIVLSKSGDNCFQLKKETDIYFYSLHFSVCLRVRVVLEILRIPDPSPVVPRLHYVRISEAEKLEVKSLSGVCVMSLSRVRRQSPTFSTWRQPNYLILWSGNIRNVENLYERNSCQLWLMIFWFRPKKYFKQIKPTFKPASVFGPLMYSYCSIFSVILNPKRAPKTISKSFQTQFDIIFQKIDYFRTLLSETGNNEE